LAGQDDKGFETNPTPYRVIADHARAAAFLIADGVVPGNIGRNYVCRMIVRRASRFGMKLGFEGPFLAPVAETVIDEYGAAYPELRANRVAILRTLNEEEKRFRSTVDTGLSHLTSLLEEVSSAGSRLVDGESAFSLYATYGLPFEITRDVAKEQGIQTDEPGFWKAMEEHRVASGAGRMMGELAEGDTDFYQSLLGGLRKTGELGPDGVLYDPYAGEGFEGRVLAIVRDGQAASDASPGDEIGLVLPRTSFYVEAGGQVADKGTIRSAKGQGWLVNVEAIQRPVDGLVLHVGRVASGHPRVGDQAIAEVDAARRLDIMRNHTATHLLHASLRAVLGEHARQAGSLVAPDRLRFDFTHPQPMTSDEVQRVERMVNEAILANHPLHIELKARAEAVAEGAMALFGETYGETVRTVSIGSGGEVSYELCGGTHVPETGVIGPFLILSEGSAAAGIRRIEAVTGREALRRIQTERASLRRLADKLGTSPDLVEQRVLDLVRDRDDVEKRFAGLREKLAEAQYRGLSPETIGAVTFLAGVVPDASAEVLRTLLDRFRAEHPTGVAVLGSVQEGRPLLVAMVTQDLVPRGLHAGELAKAAAAPMGGSGGGKPTLAQAGGKDPERLQDALRAAREWVHGRLA
jgi:alanyl-tRNA synthetase